MAVIDFALDYEEKTALDMRILSNIGKESTRILSTGGATKAPTKNA